MFSLTPVKLINKEEKKNKKHKDTIDDKNITKNNLLIINNKNEYTNYIDTDNENKDNEKSNDYVLLKNNPDGYEQYNSEFTDNDISVEALLKNNDSSYITYDEFNSQAKDEKLNTQIEDKISSLSKKNNEFISYENFIENSEYGKDLLAKEASDDYSQNKDFVKEFKSVSSTGKNDLISMAQADGMLREKQLVFSKRAKILISVVSVFLVAVLGFFSMYTINEKTKETPLVNEIFSKGLAPAKIGDKWGYIDKEGNEAISPIFDIAEPFANNGLALVFFNSKYNYINEKGEFLTEKGFTKAYSFEDNGLAAASTSGSKMGFINKKGDIVINMLYDFEKPYNTNANTLISQSSMFSSNGLVPVKNDSTMNYIDIGGNVRYSSQHIQVSTNFINDYAVVRKQNKFGYITADGKEVIPCIYEAAMPFTNKGTAVVLTGEFFNIIDKAGKVLYTIDRNENNIYDIYYYTMVSSLNIIPIVKDGKYIYTNFSYETVIEQEYDYASPFMENGKAIVLKDGFIDVIDANGTSYLKSAVKYKGTKEGIISSVLLNNGKYIPFVNQDNGKVGYLNEDGTLLMETKFDRVYGFDKDGFGIAVKDGLYGIIDNKGNVVVDFKYDMLRSIVKLS